MFQAVRHWWHSGRGQHTVRLFAFELFVVMIGVLAAQEIQSWSQRRTAIKEVESVHEQLWNDFSVYRAIARVDEAAVPCFEQRADQVLRAAGNSAPTAPALLTPAHLAGMGPDDISPENVILFRERYGYALYDRVGSMEFNLKTHEDATRSIEQLWYDFQRLDPGNGNISEADRAAVRQAAIRMKSDLAALHHSDRLIELITSQMGIPARRQMTSKAVGSCAAIWKVGSVVTRD